MSTPAVAPRLRAGPPALELRAIGKVFGKQRVLDNIDLSIEPGEFVAIVGRSGCGKTTLLRLVARLEQPDAGVLSIRTGKVRLMFQDARLLPWKTVLDNITLGLPASAREDGRAALRAVGLAGREDARPALLSGGQRQRVALARALVRRPDVLLLDEPLGALDALTRIAMHALLEKLWSEQGFTALLVTHDVQEAVALADRVILIEAGRIALDQRIDLPRPRVRGTPAFAALEDAILRRVLAHAP